MYDCSTPPTRQQAFEDFKKEKGQEINRIFTENQELLNQKKKSYSQLARQINSIKSEIDKTMEKLEQLKRDRENEGESVNRFNTNLVKSAQTQIRCSERGQLSNLVARLTSPGLEYEHLS